MKPEEPIHTGMLVWDDHGGTAHVVSIMVSCGIDGDSESQVVLSIADLLGTGRSTIKVGLQDFVKLYHRRRTLWERLDLLKIEIPEHWWPLKGHQCIKGDGVEFRIPDHGEAERDVMRAARDEILMDQRYALRSRGYREWYEKLRPLGWELVMEPPI